MKATASVAAGFAALTVIMTYPLVWHFASAVPNDLRDPLLNAWVLAWDADRFRHGLRGLWDAPVLFPLRGTLAHTEALLGIAAFTAPIDWLSGNPVAAYNFGFMLSYVLAGTGMYLLAHEVSGRRDAAVLAGLAFAFSPYRADHHGHLQVLMSGWMPVALWAMHRYFRVRSSPEASPVRRRVWLAGFAAAFLLQALSNGYFLYYLAIAVALAILWEIRLLRCGRGHTVVELAVVGVCILLAFAPVASAYYRVRSDRGQERSVGEMAGYSATPAAYGQVSPGIVLWRKVLPGARPERHLFPGLTVTLLAGVAVFHLVRRGRPAFEGTDATLERRHRLWAFYAMLATVAFILSLGPRLNVAGRSVVGPYGWLVAILPGMDGLRVTARIAVLVLIALAVLGSAGAALLLSRYRSTPAGIVAIMLGVAIVAEGYSAGVRVIPFDWRGPVPDRRVYDWLTDRPGGALLELPLRSPVDDSAIAAYEFATLRHGHPIINGSLSYGSLLNTFLAGYWSPINDPRTVGETMESLRSLGVRYIALHRRDWGKAAQADAIGRAIAAETAQIEAHETAGQTTIWQLAPWPGEAGPPDLGEVAAVDAREFRATASREARRAADAFDGDLATRWRTGRPQRGNEWFEIQLSRSRNLARLVLAIDPKRFGEYPRALSVESANADGEFRTLYDGPILRPLMHRLVQDGLEPAIVIDLPPNDTQTLRLRQTGQAEEWVWSIPEMELWERRLAGRAGR